MNDKEFPPAIMTILACPVCHGNLIAEDNEIHCVQCRRKYPIEDGIPILLADRAQQQG